MADLEAKDYGSIYDEFADLKSMLLNPVKVLSPYKNDMEITGHNLFNQACSLGLIEILEYLLPHFETIFAKDFHGQVLYDCIAIALEQKHDDVVRILLEFESSKQTHSAPKSDDSSQGLTLLQCAASNADVEIITILINSGFDINQANSKGETALHYACDAVTADVLITKGALINVLNKENKTPLHFACTSYRMGVIRKLLDNGAMPDLGLNVFPEDIVCQWDSDQSIANAILQACDDDNLYLLDIPASCVWHDMHNDSLPEFWNTPYPYCTSCKRENQLLIQAAETKKEQRRNTNTPEYPPLHAVITNYHTRYKNQLMGDMGEINAILSNGDPEIVNALDSSGATALYHAVDRNLFEVATLLLNSGADPNLTTSGKYPLVVACRFLSYEFVELLLNRGADPNVVDSYDNSPLLIAVRGLDEAVVRLLVQHGADVNHRNQNGMAAFDGSCECYVRRCGYPRIVQIKIAKYLIDSGFNFNLVIGLREPVLYNVTQSCVYGDIYNYQLFKFLLERGADMNFVNSDLNTITQIPFVVRELLRLGWNPNKPDCYGRNLLAIAFAHSNIRCARILLAAGADPNLVTWDTFVRATQYNDDSVEAIEFLLASGVKFNVPNESRLLCLSEPPELITLRDFFIPFCQDTKCIVRLFKAGASLKILATWSKQKFDSLYGRKNACTAAGLLVKAVVLAGHGVQKREEFTELLKQSDWSHARDLGSWLEEDSMTPPSLLRLSRTVIRRQLSAASGYRTILSLIDDLPISNGMRLYLKFEGPYCEIDLSGLSVMCDFCTKMSDPHYSEPRELVDDDDPAADNGDLLAENAAHDDVDDDNVH